MRQMAVDCRGYEVQRRFKTVPGSWNNSPGLWRLQCRFKRALKSDYDAHMRPLPAPPVPGKTDAERFDNAVRTAFTVPKQEIERREAEWQRTHATGKTPKSS